MDTISAIADFLSQIRQNEEKKREHLQLAIVSLMFGCDKHIAINKPINIFHSCQFKVGDPFAAEVDKLIENSSKKLEDDIIALLKNRFGGEAFTELQIYEMGANLSRKEFAQRFQNVKRKLNHVCNCPTCTAERAAQAKAKPKRKRKATK